MMGVLFRILAVALLGFGIVVLGWNEPLKYRFMSREDIAALEAPPEEDKADGTWMHDRSRKTSLDQGPYNRSGGSGRRDTGFGIRR